MAEWIQERPGSYNPDEVWDEDTETWVTCDARGNSRYTNRFVVIGSDDIGNGVIYYGEV